MIIVRTKVMNLTRVEVILLGRVSNISSTETSLR